jgi:hypothetical protein
MPVEPFEAMRTPLARLLIAAPFCLLPLGVFLHLGSGASVSVGRFEFQRRGDAKWGFQKTKISELSWAGATLRTGLAYSVGPFRVADWKEPPESPPQLANTKALAVATSAAEKAGNHAAACSSGTAIASCAALLRN